MVAGIAVSAASYSIDKLYSYRIPENMTLQPGQRVQVPFGRGNVTAEGIVITVGTGPEEKLKAVESCLDEEPLLSETQLRLAAFLRERYFCTFYDGARAMLPAGLWFRQRETFTLTADRSWETASIRKEGAREMLEAIRDQGGACRDSALNAVIRMARSGRMCCAFWPGKNGLRPRRSSCKRPGTRRKKSRLWQSLPRRLWPLP